MSAANRTMKVYELGQTRYRDVHLLQQRLQQQRREGSGVDSLLLTEHVPVFTLGRAHPEPKLRVPESLLESQHIEIVPTERGGDITYHGPGQLVAYGIVDLRGWGCSVVDFVGGLEDTAVSVLADWGIVGGRSELGRGVWVEGRKIASVGLNVRGGVTMHRIALNVDPNMEHFQYITPCGLEDVVMTSLSYEAHKAVPMPQVIESFVYHFRRIFECQAEEVDLTLGRAAS